MPAASGKAATGRPRRPPSWRDAAKGLILGTLGGIALAQLGVQSVPLLRGVHVLPFAALTGTLLGISRARRALWPLAGLACAAQFLVAYTPLVKPLIRGIVREDALRPVEAVVVLSSDMQKDGDMTAAAQVRALRGYEVLRQGYARRMLLTRLPPPKPSALGAVRAQMARLRLEYPVEEVEGVVRNTRDEALGVSRLARERGWREVILVSDASHLRRAGAVFEKAGLRALCTPCPERNYDLTTLNDPGERLHAFQQWLWETIGYEVYRLRGWI